jgi:hypothetical protein
MGLLDEKNQKAPSGPALFSPSLTRPSPNNAATVASNAAEAIHLDSRQTNGGSSQVDWRRDALAADLDRATMAAAGKADFQERNTTPTPLDDQDTSLSGRWKGPAVSHVAGRKAGSANATRTPHSRRNVP